MKLFGLVGFPIDHSWSATYFSDKFRTLDLDDHDYRLFSLPDLHELKRLILEQPDLIGFNVTIPHKINIIPLLDAIDPEARKIGAVNCVQVIRKNSQILLTGHNTDVYGFRESLEPLLKNQPYKALILGTGGASKAVAFVLEGKQIACTFVSRTKQSADILTYQALTDEIIREHNIIINTTPLGMFPNILTLPDIPYRSISSGHLVIDLVYNPSRTLFLEKSAATGAEICNGLKMLELQAEKSWSIWNQP
jgi:shikimate dehydrogenase